MHIQELQITSKDIKKQFTFYKDVLELPVEKTGVKSIRVNIGDAVLKVEEKTDFKPYHIAFHITARKEKQALQWLKNKVKILKNEKQEIIDFPAWNAKSLYFYDADKNVLEFISRRHLYKPQFAEFSASAVQGIAEIGLAVDEVEKTYKQITTETTLIKYFGDVEQFCVIGDHEGLLITVDQNTKKWFPTNDNSQKAPFYLKFIHQNKRFSLHYDGQEVSICTIK